mmetsp:Transcript_46044/g.107521  ORF Transcript_46044/g.107521 Transcript_46044/m.107521 type:complete len:1119 (+) Transcript_46044:83-3439(+)
MPLDELLAASRPRRNFSSFVRLLALLIAWRVLIGPLWDQVWALLLRRLQELARRLDGRLRLEPPMKGRHWTIKPRVAADWAEGDRRPSHDEPRLTTREAAAPLEMQAEICSVRARLQRAAGAGVRHAIHFELGPLVKLETAPVDGGAELGWDEAFHVSLSASAEALRGWNLAISCVETLAAGASRVVGRAAISLWACATGPRCHDHELRSAGEGAEAGTPIGRVAFRLTFGEHRTWQVRLDALKFSVPIDSIALELLLGSGQEPGTAAAAGGTSWLRARRHFALDRRKRATRLAYRLSQKQLVADTLFVSPAPKDLTLEDALGTAEGVGVRGEDTTRREDTYALGAAGPAAPSVPPSPALSVNRFPSVAQPAQPPHPPRQEEATATIAPSSYLAAASAALAPERTAGAAPYNGHACSLAGSTYGSSAGSVGSIGSAQGKGPSPSPSPPLPEPPVLLLRSGSSSVSSIGSTLPAAAALSSPAAALGERRDSFGGVGERLPSGEDEAWRVCVEWAAEELPAISSFGYFEELLYGTVRLQLTADSSAPEAPAPRGPQGLGGSDGEGDKMSMECRFKTGRQSALCWLRIEQLYNRSQPCRAPLGSRRGTGPEVHGSEERLEGSEAGRSADGSISVPYSVPDLETEFDEFLWVKGVRAGRVTGVVRFLSPPLFSQLLTGTLSEGGVVRQVCTVIMPRADRRAELLSVRRGPSFGFSSLWNSLVSREAEADGGAPSEPYELFVLTERLLAQIGAGAAGFADGQLGATFDGVERLLACSHKESLVSFVYTSASELHGMQALLLSFALRLLDAVPVVRYSMRARCYVTLQLLLRRGELNQLVLDQLCPGGAGLPTEIVRLLVTLLYRLLATALNGLHHGDMLEEQPSFHAAVIAICFFRVPRFADPLVEALAESAATDREQGSAAPMPPTGAGAQDVRSAGEVAIPEWRGLVFDLEHTGEAVGSPAPAQLGGVGGRLAAQAQRRGTADVTCCPLRLGPPARGGGASVARARALRVARARPACGCVALAAARGGHASLLRHLRAVGARGGQQCAGHGRVKLAHHPGLQAAAQKVLTRAQGAARHALSRVHATVGPGAAAAHAPPLRPDADRVAQDEHARRGRRERGA